ncbi:unnamed protein product, partial [Oikopleura dioica]
NVALGAIVFWLLFNFF